MKRAGRFLPMEGAGPFCFQRNPSLSIWRRPETDISHVHVEEVELPAGQVKDETVIRDLLGELGVVVPARLGAVTAAHGEKMADILVLDKAQPPIL